MKTKSPDVREKEPTKPIISPVKSPNIETPKLGSSVDAEKKPQERMAHTAKTNISKTFY